MSASLHGLFARSLSLPSAKLAIAAVRLVALPFVALPLLMALPAFATTPKHKPAAHTVPTAHATISKHGTASSSETVRARAAQAALAAKAERLRGAGEGAHRKTHEAAAETARTQTPKAHAAPATHPIPVMTAASSDFTDRAADRATQDRVHAWYKARSMSGASGTLAQATGNGSPREADAVALAADSTLGSPIVRVVPKPAQKATTPQPDLSTVARKATVEDFDRAVQQRSQTIRTVQAEQARTNTDDDDAAEAAQSHIPSTAPTERVAAPFAHGDLLAPVAMAAAAASAPTASRAMGSSATNSDFLSYRPESAAVAPATAATTAAAPANISAANLAASQALRPQGLKPASVVRIAPAPAIVAVKRAPLDPAVVDAMTDETFESDDTPAQTAHAAVVVTSRTAKADPVARPALDTAADDRNLNASGPTVNVNLYDNRGHLVMIPPMKGTHEILVHQNQMALADGLDRIEDEDQLLDMRRLKLLVALPDNDAIEVDERLPADRRYARPWSVKFLNDMGRAHYARFHTPLVITSAVRTVAFQRRLMLTNGNAAPPTGEVASPHLYGQALDIAKHGMSITEIAWMRAYLTPVEGEGKIDVEEEFQQACFHISVYRRYLGVPTRKAAAARTLQAKETPAPQPVTAGKKHHLPTAILATGLR